MIVGSAGVLMDEDRARASIWRRGGERVVRDQQHLIADLGIAQALTARVPRMAIGHVGDTASGAKPACFRGIDAGDDEGHCCHVLIVAGRTGAN